MMPQNKLRHYARNFLNAEIKEIEKILKQEKPSEKELVLLEGLLKEYKRDLDILEEED